MSKLSVAALCDNIHKANTFASSKTSRLPCDFKLLIANNHESRIRWSLKQCIYLALLLLKGKGLGFLRLLLQGRVKFFYHNFHHSKSINRLKKYKLDIGLHGAGIIYRDNLIACFSKGILNAHIGILPKYRGRSVMEWSLLSGDTTGITTFYIDAGIDTGKRIIQIEEINVTHANSILEAKNLLFSKDIESYCSAIKHELSSKPPLLEQEDQDGQRFYAMSDLLSSVVEQAL